MDIWVFDNDGTLYDDSGIVDGYKQALVVFASRALNIAPHKAWGEIKRLKEGWCVRQSVLALAKELRLEVEEVAREVYHNIDYQACGVKPDDVKKRDILNSIKARKVVMTNNLSYYARHILNYLGLIDCFSDIIGVEEMGMSRKPGAWAYREVEKRHRGFDRIIFCDDILDNLEAAHKRGWKTIWLKPKRLSVSDYMKSRHYVISSFEELKKIIEILSVC